MVTFTDHAWLLVAGELPSAAQRRILDATLVAIAEHGLVPSVAASRMTLAAAPEALQGAVAAGILGCGSVILGSADAAGRLFTAILARAANEPLEAAARAACSARCARRASPCPGYGHPLHKRQDPRVARLLAVATEAASPAATSRWRGSSSASSPEIFGKPLAMNVSGAIAAVLLDAGYPLLAIKGVPMLARTASLIAHLLEEQQRPIGFVLAHEGAAAIGYDGQRARRLRAGRRMIMQPVLRGVRIVEQGTFITGPCAGMMLADLGADVIKIESPGGDPYRAYQGGLYSPHFQAYNRNKRSVVCDLKQPADRELFERLIVDADVYIQNFRPGTAEKLGAGPARLRELNPKLVYCSISGFGASGPYVERPSYDSVAQALSGFLSVVVDEDRPRFLGPALADAITGIYAAFGVLGALLERAGSGRGKLVEVSMLEAMAHFAVEPFAAFFALGVAPKSADRPRLAQAYILRTADNRLIAIHLSSLEKFWLGLVKALDADELTRDARFSERLARISNYEALGAELDLRFRGAHLARVVGAPERATTCRSRRSTASTRSSRIRRSAISGSSCR